MIGRYNVLLMWVDTLRIIAPSKESAQVHPKWCNAKHEMKDDTIAMFFGQERDSDDKWKK